MTLERLNNFSLLSIKQETAQQINFDEIINIFAETKARKKRF